MTYPTSRHHHQGAQQSASAPRAAAACAGGQIGRVQKLPVAALNARGAFFQAAGGGELFVPRSQLPAQCVPGSLVPVFLYRSRGQIQASAKLPFLELGQTGQLRVSACRHGTAYLDMGLPKELAVPASEQRSPFIPGHQVIVYVALDGQGRLFGTQRFQRYIADRAPHGAYCAGQEVQLVAVEQTPLGFKVIVDDRYFGLIYRSALPGALSMGQRLKGYIVRLRADGRVDVTLKPPGKAGIVQCAAAVLQALEQSGGKLGLADSSPPELIAKTLGMSKAKFKQAIGHLYRSRQIIITQQGIALSSMSPHARPESAAT